MQTGKLGVRSKRGLEGFWDLRFSVQMTARPFPPGRTAAIVLRSIAAGRTACSTLLFAMAIFARAVTPALGDVSPDPAPSGPSPDPPPAKPAPTPATKPVSHPAPTPLVPP